MRAVAVARDESVTGDEPIDAAGALDLLGRHGIVASPHAAARLCAALAGDPRAVLDTARLLTPAQLGGGSALPDPLPLSRAVHEAIGTRLAALDPATRRVLLHAAVSVSDRTDAVLIAADVPIGAAISGCVSDHLVIAAGRFAFADPRVRIWVHETASLAERTDAHSASARAHAGLGDERLALWHRALSTLDGDRSLVVPLLAVAREACDAGDAEWAHAVAREAACHAVGDERAAAQTLAGVAALEAGLVDDAVDWLRDPVSSTDADTAAAALAAFVHAATLHEGHVADMALEQQLARLEPHPPQPRIAHLVQAIVTAANLHAERGSAVESAELLRQGRLLIAEHGTEEPDAELSLELALGDAWCDVFGPPPEPGTAATADAIDAWPALPGRQLQAAVGRALRLARADHHAAALRALHPSERGAFRAVSPAALPAWGTHRPSPLGEAQRRVAAALIEFWAGDLSRARSELHAAACSTPIALAFAGLGVALARRLDICALGRPGTVATALEATTPAATARHLGGELLVDRAIRASFDGRMTESATLLSLAADGAFGRRGGGLHLPGLDEAPAWTLAGRMHEARHAARTADHPGYSPVQHEAAVLRELIATCPSETLPTVVDHAGEVAHRLLSPFERSRVELELGRRLAANGDLDGARRHLVGAARLFGEIGAEAWAQAAEADLGALPAGASLATAPPPETTPVAPAVTPATLPHDHGAASESGVAWSAPLTERELEVAELVAEGYSNRDVANELFVSVRTVEVHVARVFAKLGVHSRVELALLAHRAPSAPAVPNAPAAPAAPAIRT